MKNEEVNPSEEEQKSDTTQLSTESGAGGKDVGEMEKNPLTSDLPEFSGVDEDEMIVVLDDSDEFDSVSDVPLRLSASPEDDQIQDELEELPEMSVELVDDLPEVEDVEDITSLVEDGDSEFDDGLHDSHDDLFERVKELTIEYWKPGVMAAALLFTVSLVFSSLWSNVGSTENAAADSSKTATIIVDFENWVDEILDQHMVGTGTEEK